MADRRDETSMDCVRSIELSRFDSPKYYKLEGVKCGEIDWLGLIIFHMISCCASSDLCLFGFLMGDLFLC